jgi:hypothetical protein
MNRVGPKLARGIIAALFACLGGGLSDAEIRPLDRALGAVRGQNFGPLLEVAARRVSAYFTPDREALFLEELFSLSGKWKALTRGRDSYERYVRRAFEKHVYSPEDFKSVLAQIRSDYEFALQASENRLLVALYEDVRPRRPEMTFESFRMEYYRLVDRLAPDVLQDLAMNGVSIGASEAAAVVFTAALSTSGILGGSAVAGGAGGAASLGIGLVVALAVGWAIDATAGEAYESAARTELHVEVNALRNRLVDDVTDALAEALAAYARLQEECVLRLYSGGRHDVLAAGR